MNQSQWDSPAYRQKLLRSGAIGSSDPELVARLVEEGHQARLAYNTEKINALRERARWRQKGIGPNYISSFTPVKS